MKESFWGEFDSARGGVNLVVEGHDIL